jgi:hypothetical protein
MKYEGDPSEFTGFEDSGLTPDVLADTFHQSLEGTRAFAETDADVRTELIADDGTSVGFSRDEFESVEADRQSGKFIFRLAKGAEEHKVAVISVTGAALLAGAAAWTYRHHKKR